MAGRDEQAQTWSKRWREEGARRDERAAAMSQLPMVRQGDASERRQSQNQSGQCLYRGADTLRDAGADTRSAGRV